MSDVIKALVIEATAAAVAAVNPKLDRILELLEAQANADGFGKPQQTAGNAAAEDTAGEETTEEVELTPAEKKKAAAAKKKADAAEKKKAAPKKDKKPEVDLTPFKEQVGDFLEWLGSDKEDEIAKILEEFSAESADEVPDENYAEFYKLVRELAAEEFDLSEVEDLLAA